MTREELLKRIDEAHKAVQRRLDDPVNYGLDILQMRDALEAARAYLTAPAPDVAEVVERIDRELIGQSISDNQSVLLTDARTLLLQQPAPEPVPVPDVVDLVRDIAHLSRGGHAWVAPEWLERVRAALVQRQAPAPPEHVAAVVAGMDVHINADDTDVPFSTKEILRAARHLLLQRLQPHPDHEELIQRLENADELYEQETTVVLTHNTIRDAISALTWADPRHTDEPPAKRPFHYNPIPEDPPEDEGEPKLGPDLGRVCPNADYIANMSDNDGSFPDFAQIYALCHIAQALRDLTAAVREK